MRSPDKSLLNQHRQMRKEALDYVKFLVNEKFLKNKNVSHFYLAMGSYFFVDTNDEIMHAFKYKRLDYFLQEWDNDLKITGEGIQIHRNGKIITDW